MSVRRLAPQPAHQDADGSPLTTSGRSRGPASGNDDAVMTAARVAPALPALAYPAFLWAVPAVSPVWLAFSLIVPATAVLSAHLWGGDRHIAVMTVLRTVYRAPAVEGVLLTAIVFQPLSGLRLLRPHVERGRSWWETAQVTSGVYLGMFLISHLTAALRSRWLGVETDWVWLTADSMLTNAWTARLAPHYTLGVIAFGVHAGLGLRYVLRQKGWPPVLADRVGVLVPACAVVASVLIMAALFTA